MSRIVTLFTLFALCFFQANSIKMKEKVDQHLVLGHYKFKPKEVIVDHPGRVKLNNVMYEKRE